MLDNSELLALIKERVCYTDLVYQRVNTKLKVDLSRAEIETLVQAILGDQQAMLKKREKNYYVTSLARHTRLTINSFNFRLITADRI